MSESVLVESTVSADSGIIVVEVTVYDNRGVPLSEGLQPKARYYVIDTNIPSPRVCHTCSSLGEASGWAEGVGRRVLEEGEIDDYFLREAFKAGYPRIPGGAGLPLRPVKVTCMYSGKVSVKQFTHRWIVASAELGDLLPLKFLFGLENKAQLKKWFPGSHDDDSVPSSGASPDGPATRRRRGPGGR